MVQQAWNNVTIPPSGAYAPDALGWSDAIFANRTAVQCNVTLQAADLNDPTLIIDGYIEYTNDPSGVSGWQILDGITWNGGPQGRAHVASQPVLGPLSTTTWPEFQRLRIHGSPSRTISGVRVVAQAT